MPTAEVIKQLSPVIRGWCNYCRHAVAKRRSANLDPQVWRVTYKWAKRRHPRQNRRWVVHRYYGVDQGRGWDLWAGHNRLPRHNETRVSRFVKVKGKASPFAPSLRDYWGNRRHRRRVREAGPFHRVHSATAGGSVRGLPSGPRSGPRARAATSTSWRAATPPPGK